MKTGVNFAANSWSYTLSSSTFETMCQKLKGKVSNINFCPHWITIENRMVDNQNTLLDDLIRLSNIASANGFVVSMNIHTHMKTTYALPPDLDGNFCKIFDYPSLYQRWLDLLDYVTAYLHGKVNLAWFDMMNEPARYSGDPCGAVSLDSWMQLFSDMYQTCKQNMPNVPLGLRIAEPSLPSFNYDTRIFDYLDVFTTNVYIPRYSTESEYHQLIDWIKSNSNKRIIMDEFGHEGDETTQAEGIRRQLELFKDDGLDVANAWILNPDGSVQDGYGQWNLARNSTEFKQAIDVLAEFNEEIPPPPPPPPPDQDIVGPLGIWRFPVVNWLGTLFPEVKTRTSRLIEDVEERWKKFSARTSRT